MTEKWSDDKENEDETMESIIATVSLEEFLNNEKTKNILEYEFNDAFDKNINDSLEHISMHYYYLYNIFHMIYKDDEIVNITDILCIIHKYVMKTYNTSIFSNNPELALSIFQD